MAIEDRSNDEIRLNTSENCMGKISMQGKIFFIGRTTRNRLLQALKLYQNEKVHNMEEVSMKNQSFIFLSISVQVEKLEVKKMPT